MEDKFIKLQKSNRIFAIIFAITFVLQIIGEVRYLLLHGETLSVAPSSFYVIFAGCIFLDCILLYFVYIYFKRSKAGVPRDKDPNFVFQMRSKAFRSMVFTTVVVLVMLMPVKIVARGMMDALIYSAGARQIQMENATNPDETNVE